MHSKILTEGVVKTEVVVKTEGVAKTEGVVKTQLTSTSLPSLNVTMIQTSHLNSMSGFSNSNQAVTFLPTGQTFQYIFFV